MKVLLIDDEENALELLTLAVKETIPNAEIFASLNVDMALRYAHNNEINIAFLDIEMGAENGLDVAKKLKKINAQINIVFVTGYSQYMADAFQIYASDYIMKPVTASKVRSALDNLRNPIQQKTNIRIQTFGNFEIFVNNEIVSFKRRKAKECLAYLVDRHGASVTKKEMAAVLFEYEEYNRQSQDLLSKQLAELYSGLKSVGAQRILIKKFNAYAVDTTQFDCDMYEYENGNPLAINSFHGEYMSQYSWAELSIGKFYK